MFHRVIQKITLAQFFLDTVYICYKEFNIQATFFNKNSFKIVLPFWDSQ